MAMSFSRSAHRVLICRSPEPDNANIPVVCRAECASMQCNTEGAQRHCILSRCLKPRYEQKHHDNGPMMMMNASKGQCAYCICNASQPVCSLQQGL